MAVAGVFKIAKIPIADRNEMRESRVWNSGSGAMSRQ
jgi:hypothetical protein